MSSKSKKFKNICLPNNIVLKDYKIIKRISSGGFSFVYLAKSIITNETVVIKEYMPNSISVREKGYHVYIKNVNDKERFKRGLDHFFKEMSIISQIKHNNIIDIMDYFEANNTAYIVTPYEYGVPLFSFISSLKKKKEYINDKDLVKISLGILEAIKALHDNDILHLDLKPGNIWLRPNKEVLILDFGTSLERNQVRTDQWFFTPGYAAIEQYKKYYSPLNLSHWTDYYGIGATIYNLITQKNPMDSIKLKESNTKLNIKNEYPILYHYKIIEIIEELYQIDVEPRKNINISEMIKDIKNIIPFDFYYENLNDILNDDKNKIII